MKPEKSQEIDENFAKTLYVRLPHTIKNSKEIEELFGCDVQVKLTRQSSRHCHVVFPTVGEKMKHYKSIKNVKIDGKKIIAFPPKISPTKEKKITGKKIRVPKPKPEPKVTKSLHISNIKPGTKAREIKDAFPGCVSVVMIKSNNGPNRIAMIKLASTQLAGEYLRKEREWPTIRGNVVAIRADTRKRIKKPGRKKSTGLKIYDGDTEETSEVTSQKKKVSTNSENPESKDTQDSEDESEEEVEKQEEDDDEEDEDEEELDSDENTDGQEE